MLEKGTLLKTKTRTLENTFGEVVWEVVETGLKAPEKEREGQMDGVKCIMMRGTGPSARAGFSVIDSEWQIGRDIVAGITRIVSLAEV